MMGILRLLIGFAFVISVCFYGVRGQNEIRLYTRCGSNGNYTSNSTYAANLNRVFSSITTNDQINYGFYNVSVGEVVDRVYAVALCRGDVSFAACRRCVNFSTVDLPELCSVQREAIVWYDNCMLRYSNSNIFRQDVGPIYFKWNNKNVTDLQGLNRALEDLLTDLRKKASSGNSLRKYAFGSANYTLFGDIYALVQCTPDLTERACSNCLDAAFGEISNRFPGKEGGRVYRPSCNFRYEIYQFYDSTSVPPPSPSPLVPQPPPPLLAVSPPKNIPGEEVGNFTVRNIIIVTVSTASFVVLVICIYAVFMCKRLRNRRKSGDDMNTGESLQFEFHTIVDATNNFSNDNMVGSGGFGAVYKGTLADGQKVAVKRLAEKSGQGDLEFKNEVQLLAKLQHRNLVRLLGFCLQGQERLLIYEFVPNASLDQFLFDPSKRTELNWQMRYKIIGGIIRGLVYLHEDSRLRIIHRDLKASNILLDGQLNPKIADFGMARLFVTDQTQAETKRVVGTYGYMAPEYAIYGQFSVKTDIYSFGVLILELVCGQKNSCFRVGESTEDLISFSWERWKAGKAADIIDPAILDGSKDEVMRCIHIALLCVQESVAARPIMGSIVLMLSSYSVSLPVPAKPAFLMHSIVEPEPLITPQEDSSRKTWSNNEVSITELSPR